MQTRQADTENAGMEEHDVKTSGTRNDDGGLWAR